MKTSIDDREGLSLQNIVTEYKWHILVGLIYVISQIVIAELAKNSNICNNVFDGHVNEWVLYFMSSSTSANFILSIICILMFRNKYDEDDSKIFISVFICNIFNLVSNILALSGVGGLCIDALGVNTFGAMWPTFITQNLFLLYSAYGIYSTSLSTNGSDSEKQNKYVYKCWLNLCLFLIFLFICFPFYTNAPYGLAIFVPVICTCYFIYVALDLYMSERDQTWKSLFLHERFFLSVPEDEVIENATDEPIDQGTINKILAKAAKRIKKNLMWYFVLSFLRYPLFYLFAATNVYNGSFDLFFQVLFNFVDSLFLTCSLIESYFSSRMFSFTKLQDEVVATVRRRNHLRMVFHDVRGPLSNVTQGLELLFSNDEFIQMFNKEDDDTQETLTDMQVAAEDCMSTLNCCLEMEKIESDEMARLLLNEFEPRQLVEKVRKLNAPKARKQRIDLKIDVGSNVPETLKGDIFKLQHILMNLLSNSIKYSPENTCITIKVESKPSEQSQQSPRALEEKKRYRLYQDRSSRPPSPVPSLSRHVSDDKRKPTNNSPEPLPSPLRMGRQSSIGDSLLQAVKKTFGTTSSNDYDETQLNNYITNPNAEYSDVTFSVVDQGQGMSAEELTKLFQPFMQGKHKVKQTVESTGLGLAQCKRNVELHHGKIGCTSKYIDDYPEEHGTTFWFTLPLEIVQANKRFSVFRQLSSESRLHSSLGSSQMKLKMLASEQRQQSFSSKVDACNDQFPISWSPSSRQQFQLSNKDASRDIDNVSQVSSAASVTASEVSMVSLTAPRSPQVTAKGNESSTITFNEKLAILIVDGKIMT